MPTAPRSEAFGFLRVATHVNRVVDPEAARQRHVVVKLFNVLQRELGPALLARGVQVAGKVLADLFRGRSAAFCGGILTAQIDEIAVDPQVPVTMDWTAQDVFLQVRLSSQAST